MAAIPPTPGRVVWFYPGPHDSFRSLSNGRPLAAIVAWVHNDSMVNLSVIGPNGTQEPRTSVRLVQPNEEAPDFSYCSWMPYQIGQSQKTEALEKQLAAAGKNPSGMGAPPG